MKILRPLATLLLVLGGARAGLAQSGSAVDLSRATLEAINAQAYLNATELIGAPQNPRRITIGFELRVK